MIVDFNRRSDEGQMLPIEREAMYTAVIINDCKCMLEIGTWKGGGSTYILASAALTLSGMLHTIESNLNAQSYAEKLYKTELSYLKPNVKFYSDNSENILNDLTTQNQFDFVLLDGENNGEQTLKEFSLINPKLKQGSIIAVHDWNMDKASKIKPILENKTFENIFKITYTSTGFAIFRKLL